MEVSLKLAIETLCELLIYHRYTNYTMGCFTFFMFVCRFFLFHLFESPKFLLSKGRQADAVVSVRGIAYHNGAKTWLSEEILDEIGGRADEVGGQKLTTKQVILRQTEKFSTQRIKPLFAYKKLGINTTLLWYMWTAIGMGYPLFNVRLSYICTNPMLTFHRPSSPSTSRRLIRTLLLLRYP